MAGGSVSIGGRLNLSSAGIRWPDGTTQTGRSIGISSYNFKSDFGMTVSSTSYGGCFSTVSFTTAAAFDHAEIILGLNFSDANANRVGCANVLVNGAYMSPFSATKGMACDERVTTSSGNNGLLHKTVFIPGSSLPSSGTVQFCLTLRTDGGTLTFPGGFDGNEINQWGVKVYQ